MQNYSVKTDHTDYTIRNYQPRLLKLIADNCQKVQKIIQIVYF